MRRLVCLAVLSAIVVLPIIALADGPAAQPPAQTPPQAQKPVAVGMVKSVTNDAQGALASFVLRKPRKAGGGELTVTVDANTKYVKMPGRQTAAATDIKAGVKVAVRFRTQVGQGPAVGVMIIPARTHGGGGGGATPAPPANP